MKSILLIDHGSMRAEANHMLACMANLVQAMAGDGVIVEMAHMELAEPSIEAGFGACVRRGASEVVAFPYMLSPGKHSTRDIPRLVAEAGSRFPGVAYRVTAAFGVHEKLGELILERAGVGRVSAEVPEQCWNPEGKECECGAACRVAERGAPATA